MDIKRLKQRPREHLRILSYRPINAAGYPMSHCPWRRRSDECSTGSRFFSSSCRQQGTHRVILSARALHWVARTCISAFTKSRTMCHCVQAAISSLVMCYFGPPTNAIVVLNENNRLPINNDLRSSSHMPLIMVCIKHVRSLHLILTLFVPPESW